MILFLNRALQTQHVKITLHNFIIIFKFLLGIYYGVQDEFW